ncbi:hypothetical protein [Denitrificimonas caeni]|uniref:hypothetical protein n=1 Tax=Denitrificimonas caeni TaxID=521720 RepID=UPI0003B3D7FA|nr:hypothetical protein [Denitrificimonas caeni]
MKNRVYALCLSALFALPSHLLAADAKPSTAQQAINNSLNALFLVRLETQRSIGGFYMLNSQEQDQRYAKQAEANLVLAQENFKNIPTPSSPAAQTLKVKLEQDLSTYSNELRRLISVLKEQGYTDLQPIADLASLNSSILQTSKDLEAQIQQDNQYTLPKLTQLAREQSLLIQGIAADYAARSGSVGASFIADGEKQPLDKLSEQFANTLLAMQKDPTNTNDTKKSLRAIQVKWRYIENSLKNYNEDSVPFVIDKYARSITKNLEQLANQYASLNI